MDTTLLNKNDVKRKYYLIDVKGKILGRVASFVALLLSGKRKSHYTPSVDNGDFVILINADKFKVTGAKLGEKLYTRYSGYPSGLKVKNLETLLETKPTEVLHHAIKGMLPKNKLGSRMITRLKLYSGTEHPHGAQNPENIEVSEG